MKNLLQVNRALVAKKTFTNFKSDLTGMVRKWYGNGSINSRLDSLSIVCRQSDLRTYRAKSSCETFSVGQCSPHTFPFEAKSQLASSRQSDLDYSHRSDLRYSRATLALLSRFWKYAAMVTLLLTLACTNVWGATTAPTGAVHTPGSVADANLVTFAGKKYEVYFSNNASKSSLLVGSNTSATTQATGTDKWCNIGSSCGNNNNNISTAFTLNEFVSNVKTSNNKAIRVQGMNQSEKCVVMVVSGYDSIAVLDKGEVKVFAEIWNGTSYGSAAQISASYSRSQSSHHKRAHPLDKTKQYRLTLTYGASGSTNKDLVAFSLCYTPATPSSTYYYRGADNSWGATAMTPSAGGTYEYYATTTNNHQFKIALSADGWDYNYTYVDAGFYGTTSNIGDYSSNNCYVWSAPANYYIVVFKPNTAINTTNNPKICATTSNTLPKDQFTITFAANSGSGTMSAIGSLNAGATQVLPANAFTRSGYNFTGWKTNVAVTANGSAVAANGIVPNSASISNILSDITLTAQWELIPTYDVTYNANGGTGGSTASQTGNSTGDQVTTRDNGFTRSGYKFKWWNTAANGSGEDFYPGEKVTIATSNVNLYAQWEQVSEGWEFWCGSPNAFTTSQAVVGDMVLTAGGGSTTINTGMEADATIVSKYNSSVDKHAICIAVASNDQYVQVSFSDGSPINSLKLWATTNQNSSKKLVVIYSTTADFSSGQYEAKEVSVPANNASSKAMTDFSPVTADKYFYARIYRKVATAVYGFTGGSGNTARIYGVKAQKGANCTAPSALAAATPTAKGITLSVTDANNVNNYEFYVSTSSTAPEAGATATHSVSSAKSLTITNLVAGTTYYAWARSVCGVSNKSGWTALTGNTFTTSTVNVDYHLTNVTKTSGAATAGGSTFTAVFAAVSGYSMPTPTVTIGGNAATSGTDYTWSSGTLTINADKINGDIDITLTSTAAAPTNVAISGEWLYFAGETITLTATPTGGNGPVTYQWYKGGKADGNAISGATSATFTKTCAFEDAGSYYCKVTCGGSASTWGQNGDAYDVKIPRLYVKTGHNYDLVKTDYGNVDFTRATASTATASISLGSNWDYCFNIADGCGHYYGNAGTMQYNSYGPWVTNVNNQDCGLRTTNGATYIFTINYSNWTQLTTTVTFPVSNQAAGKVIYFDNNVLNWTGSSIYYRIGHATHSQHDQMTLVPGTANLYKMTTREYNNFMGWFIANAQGGSGTNKSIYNTVNTPAITKATAHEGGAVTQSAVTVTPTTSRGAGQDIGINDNCTFYNYDITSGMKTDNVAITAPSNGTITVSYTDVNNAAQSFTSGNRDLAHTVIITPMAAPSTGYDLSTLTVNGSAHPNNTTYTCSGATVVAATFSLHNYNVTYSAPGNGNNYTIKVGSGSASSASKTATMGQTITIVASPATGYDFTGWTISKAGGGTVTPADASATTTTFTMPADNVTITASFTLKTYTITYNAGSGAGISGSHANDTKTYGVALTLPGVTFTRTGYTQTGWATSDGGSQAYALSASYTANAAANLYPVWTAKTTTITINANTANHGSTTPGTVTATWGSALPSFTAASGASGWNLTGYWTAATGGNKIINADGTLVASTSYADGSGNWNSEAATLTLYAQYDEILYHVTYNGNSPTSGSVPTDATNYAPNAEVTVKGNTGNLAKTGYTFRGWTDGTTFFLAGQKFNINSDVTLTAVWDGGSAAESCTTFTGSSTAYSYATTHWTMYSADSNGRFSTTNRWSANQTGCNGSAYSFSGDKRFVIVFDQDVASIHFHAYNGAARTLSAIKTTTTEPVAGKTASYTALTSGTDYTCTKTGTTGCQEFEIVFDEAIASGTWIWIELSNSAVIQEMCYTPGGGGSSGFTVSFADQTGFTGSSTLPDNIVGVPSGSKIVQPADPTAAGYTFGGWYSNAVCTAGNEINWSTMTITADKTIYAKWTAGQFSVSHSLTNVTKTSGATGANAATAGTDYTAVFAAASGYALPSSITVTIGGATKTQGTEYTWDQSTGTVVVNGAYITGNIVITVAGVALVYHNVSFSLTNVSYSSGDNQGANAATEGVAFSTVFAGNTGYNLPDAITVTIGGITQTAGTGYTWTKASGTLTISAAYITGDIVVTIVGEEAADCEEVFAGRATDKSTFTTSVGSATTALASNGGDSFSAGGYSYSVKPNSTDAIVATPKAGSSFAAGDSVIVVVYNNNSGSKKMGFKLKSTGEVSTSVESKALHTFRVVLAAGDIESGNVKFNRQSSDDRWVEIIIKKCGLLPTCTTPIIPSLSDQTVCPGGNPAAWNATQTASLQTGETASYSWKKKGSETVLATTASFDVSNNVTEGQAGTYVVTVTVSALGKASSSASKEVNLSVTAAVEEPVITANKAKVYAGDQVIFTATCGTAGVTWQWYRCTNAAGSQTGSCLSTTSSYTLASAPSAGTYYYKAIATGSCGSASTVYTLVVSAANACDKEFWFAKEADRPTGAAAATHITGCPSGSSSASYTASIDGTNYALTGSTGQKTGNITIVVPADNTGTLYVVVQGSSSRTLTLSKGGTQIDQQTPTNSVWGVYTFSDLEAGTYNLVSSGNISWSVIALKLCPTVSCTDDTPTATATNTTVCAGGTITITATGYETGATFQWQKQNASTNAWEDIDGATSATYTVATAAAEHAGNYQIVTTKTCARTSNTVTIAVPSAPVFNSFTATRSIMATLALSISDVEATDAVSYKWYKSANNTWEATDDLIGETKNLVKAYAGETAGSTYYLFCQATNSCGTTTSGAIRINVTAYVEEDCAIRGNEGSAEFGFVNTSMSSGTYDSKNVWYKSGNSAYLTYSAPDGKYLKTAKVTIASSNSSNASYQWSTDGSSWTAVTISGLTTTLTEKEIDLSVKGSGRVTHFRIGRNLGGAGASSGTFYLHKACFEYTEACTATTVTPSASSPSHTIGNAFTEPTFTVKHGNTAFSPQPTLTYSSSDEDIATVDDEGAVSFQNRAGTVVITASYAGDATYCASSGSYTITVSCSDEAPKIVAASGTNLSGCNTSVTLNAKKQNGSDFSDGTFQWFRDGEAIAGATGSSYTANRAGVYTVERTSVGGCTSPSTNKAKITSTDVEPDVERLVPFQYYHVNKTYTDQMKMRHLFAVKYSGTKDGKNFDMTLSRNGGAPTNVTSSNSFSVIQNADHSIDTVMIDLNRLNGKYAEGDTLVLTCSAIDCQGNVSATYRETITIYVIGATPTLALICSGSSKAEGTRKESELTVGGDFLTGYNKADLCEQTGKESFNANTEWGLYTRLKANYIVTPVNGYAVFNKLNYEPFDILLLTDYPKASKSDAAKDVLDDMADLCDYRPMLSFKAHMVAKSPSKWAAKGFTTAPVAVKQGDGRTHLNIVCYAHPMFDGIKDAGDHIFKDNDATGQIVYEMLTGTGYESSKGIQGFEIAAAENFVTIGLIHYNASVSENNPSTGMATWTGGTDKEGKPNDRILVAAVERQTNPEARMVVLAVNCGAQSKFTETGRTIVHKCLQYLLSDYTITPMADCSFTFDNGAGALHDADWYKDDENCPGCTGTLGDGKWSTAANWAPDRLTPPGKDTEVKIAAPVEVDMTHAIARSARIVEGGHITIPAGKALEIVGTIRRLDGTEISSTENSDIFIGSTLSGNGTLIFNNDKGDSKATVAMYTNALADIANMSAATSTWQYIGTPHNDIAHAQGNYYDSWLYQQKDSYEGWDVVPNNGPLVPFRGYCVTHPDAGHTFVMEGTLTATGTVDIDIPSGKYVVVANSWTAPIDITTLTDDDMENITDKTIYFFNTGTDADANHGTGTAPGTYVSVPKNSASYVGNWQIPSMQGFYVVGGSSNGTLHLDYNRHVRPIDTRTIVSRPMYAPRRAEAAETGEPAVLKIYARGSRYYDRLVVLEREDYTRGYDSGWDGEAWGGSDLSPMVYVTGEGREDAVSAIPDFEGTVIAFKAGEDNNYRLDFVYDEEEEPLYLLDTENSTYTQIVNNGSYSFTTSDKSAHNRFVLTRRAPQIATGVDGVQDDNGAKAMKFIKDDKLYIFMRGVLYDATGKVVK